jgi:hypothetical protein
MHAITKARYPGHQIRPDECTSLIAIPAQANQVFLKYRLRSPLGRTGSARRPKLSLAFSGQPTRPRLLVRAETEPVAIESKDCCEQPTPFYQLHRRNLGHFSPHLY